MLIYSITVIQSLSEEPPTTTGVSMYKYEVKVGQLKVAANAWSPGDVQQYGLSNWSLRPIQKQKDAYYEHRRLANGLCAALVSMGVQRAYAPNVVVASARIVDTSELTVRIKLGVELHIYRNQEFPADGVFLWPGDAFMMSGAGCPLIIATAGENMVVSHAGRDSLIDRGAVMGKPTRNCGSVVDSVIDALLNRKIPAGDINMCMMFAVPAEKFGHPESHPVHGEFNRRMGVYAHNLWPGSVTKKDGTIFIDLEALFVEQARQRGVLHAWTMRSLTEHPDLAHTRDGKNISRRNLYVVRRNA